MNAYEFNKIAGAVLAALLVIVGGRVLVNEALHVKGPKEPAFMVASLDTGATATDAEAEAEPDVEPIGLRLASADADAGLKVFRKCSACHKVDAGAANGVGPNLHNIVGKDIAAADGFSYSSAMAGWDGGWTHEALDAFLADPKGWMPGTKMGFRGLKKPEDRAAVIAYLRANTENPPEIEAAAAQ